MGGHQSTQSAKDTTTVVSTAIQNVAQNCINYVNSDNDVVVSGNGNVVGDVTQTLSISVNSSCVAQLTQDAGFENNFENEVAQLLEDKEEAMTQWLDSSQDSVSSDVKNSITNNIKSDTVQTCLNNINSKNILDVSGNDNVVKNIVQSSTTNLITQCMLGQGQTSNTVNDVTNDINQHSQYTAESPFAFITDAIEAIAKSSMALIALGVIMLICFVSIIYILHRYHKKQADEKYIRLIAPPSA